MTICWITPAPQLAWLARNTIIATMTCTSSVSTRSSTAGPARRVSVRIGLWLNGGFSNDTIQHELGHNLGLYHANAWVPSQGDSPIGDGKHEEYGDPYDNMGNYSPYGHFNVYFKNYLSWIPNTSVKSVSRTGTYRLKAHDHRRVQHRSASAEDC